MTGYESLSNNSINSSLDEVYESLDILLSKLQKEKGIYIYGAGFLGRMLCEQLNCAGISPSLVWDSNKDSIKPINGTVVEFPFEGECINKDGLVIISIDSPDNTGIVQLLNDNGFYRVIDGYHFKHQLLSLGCKDLYQEDGNGQLSLNKCMRCGNLDYCPVRRTYYDNKYESSYDEDNEYAELKNITGDIYYLSVTTTFSCNLNCKYCAAFIPYRSKEQMRIIDVDLLISQVSKIVKVARYIENVMLTGGEIFLSKEIHRLVEYLLSKKNIGFIQIFTNGTVKPTEAFIKLAKEYKDKILLFVSEYQHIDYSSFRLRDFLEAEDIPFYINPDDMNNWIDFSDVSKRGHNAHRLEKICNGCFLFNQKRRVDLTYGYVSARCCSAAPIRHYLNMQDDFPDEAMPIDKIDINDLPNILNNMHNVSYLKMCDYCGRPEKKLVATAEQERKDDKDECSKQR